MLRSFLYVPGDDLVKLTKALTRGSDALIVDLEDGVALDKKDFARSVVSEFLQGKEDSWPSIWVRLNPGSLLPLDLTAVPTAAPDGVVLAKTESAILFPDWVIRSQLWRWSKVGLASRIC